MVLAFRKTVLALAIPLNLALPVWMALGPSLFTGPAWTAQLTLLATPALVLCLTVTTVMIFSQQARPVRITTGQARAQSGCWLAMFVYGLTMVDSDAQRSFPSVLMKLLAENSTTETISSILWWTSAIGGVLAWGTLLDRLRPGRRSAPIWTPPPAPTPQPWAIVSPYSPQATQSRFVQPATPAHILRQRRS